MSSQPLNAWIVEIARIAMVLVVVLGGCLGCMVDGGDRMVELPDVGYNVRWRAGHGKSNYKIIECYGRLVELWTDGYVTDSSTIKLHVEIAFLGTGTKSDSNIHAKIVDSHTSEEIVLSAEGNGGYDLLEAWNHGGGFTIHVPLGHMDEANPAFELMFDICVIDNGAILLRSGRFYAVRMAAKG